MARGTLVSDLLKMLKGELKYTQDSSATGTDTEFIQSLHNKQKWLSCEYDWPFLDNRWDLSASAGGRFFTIPTTTSAVASPSAVSATINFERAVKLKVLWNGKWEHVYEGVGFQEYNTFDSETSVAIDPIQRWRMADNNGAASGHIEVWPIPVTTQTIRFWGQREPIALTAGTDRADLDDTLLVLFTAAELAMNDQIKAQKQTAATERLRKLIGNYPERKRRVIFGQEGTSLGEKRVRTVPLVAVAGGGH